MGDITDRAAFQLLCDEALSLHAAWGYEIRRVGVGSHGTKAGSPDSWGYDKQRRLCAFEYGSSQDWETKLEKDLQTVKALAESGFNPAVFVFCTNQEPSANALHHWQAKVRNDYGWDLHLVSGGDLALALDTDCQGIRRDRLRIALRDHTWPSLTAHCQAHLQLFTHRYLGKYQPDLYVGRTCEATLLSWYEQTRSLQADSDNARRVAFLVGEAGTGKSNVALHLAQQLVERTAVIVLPGNLTLSDSHALERAIVDAAGYPAAGQVYHADLDRMCELARSAGELLVVVIDGVNERADLVSFRQSLKELLFSYRDRALAVLVTCRDSMWWHLRDSLWRGLAYVPDGFDPEKCIIPLKPYSNEEFQNAAATYFRHFDVHAALGSDAANLLLSPLLLALFSEVHQSHALGFVPQVDEWQLWQRYLERRLQDVSDGIGRSLVAGAVEKVLEVIALHMLDADGPELSPEMFAGIPNLELDDTSPTSLFLRLKDAGILLQDGNGAVRFTYERCLEFVLGQLVARQLDDPSTRADALARVRNLISGHRWGQLVINAIELAGRPDEPLALTLNQNLWLGSAAVYRLGDRAPLVLRDQTVARLLELLISRFEFDRSRAATWLSRLQATKAVDALWSEWSSRRPIWALTALARLGDQRISTELVAYLGRHVNWFLAENEDLLRNAPIAFRTGLQARARELLADDEHGVAAAHVLGYLRDPDAVQPLLDQARRVGWTAGVAFVALLRIGSPEAFQCLREALGEASKCASRLDVEVQEARNSGSTDVADRLNRGRNALVHAIDHVRVSGFQHGVTPSAIAFLIGLVSHEQWYVRNMAVQSLANLRVGQATEAIVRASDLGFSHMSSPFEAFGTTIDVDSLIAIVEDDSATSVVRRRAIEALGYSRNVKAAPILQSLLRDRMELDTTVVALGHLRRGEVVPDLCELMQDASIDILIREHTIPFALGSIRDKRALATLELIIRENLPSPPWEAVEAYVYIALTGAIELLREIWLAGCWDRSEIIGALRWLGEDAAVGTIVGLIGDEPIEAAGTLTETLWQGVGLGHFGGWHMVGRLHDQLVGVLERGLPHLAPDQQQKGVWALRDAATPAAIRLLERIATDESFEGLAGLPGQERSVREQAIFALKELGSPTGVVVAAVLAELSSDSPTLGVYHMSKMPRGAAIESLSASLDTLPTKGLVQALNMLGWMADLSVLPDVRRFISDERHGVADAAYEAEQRLMGLADDV
ncbi:MAG: hypothetical protein ACYDCQ_00730 [Dehalococcoidia bacterium]